MALVIDRLFLWLFGAICLLGTVVIICQAPMIYDSRVPIVHWNGDSPSLNIQWIPLTTNGFVRRRDRSRNVAISHQPTYDYMYLWYHRSQGIGQRGGPGGLGPHFTVRVHTVFLAPHLIPFCDIESWSSGYIYIWHLIHHLSKNWKCMAKPIL